MSISYDNISRIQINLSITLIRIININIRESLLYMRIKNTKTIKVIVRNKQTLKSRYSLRRLDYKSPHYQAEIRSIRNLLIDLSSSNKNNHIDSYFNHAMGIIKIRIVISIKIAFSLDLRRSIKLTLSTRKVS